MMLACIAVDLAQRSPNKYSAVAVFVLLVVEVVTISTATYINVRTVVSMGVRLPRLGGSRLVLINIAVFTVAATSGIFYSLYNTKVITGIYTCRVKCSSGC